jgi:peptide/nickel transport system substrate-binding protein
LDPKWIRVCAVVVAAIAVISGAAIYYVLSRPNCTSALNGTDPIKFDEPALPDSMDPARTFSTPGWGAVQQIYQPLITYNGSSDTTFVGVLAQNWSSSNGGFNYNFTLWPSEHFSNSDPINAYVIWYSLYRGLVMDQPAEGPQFILAENFWYPGVNWTSPASEVDGSIANLTTDLNTWNFSSPSSIAVAAMEAPNQSFQVVDNLTIELNLGDGYLGQVPYTYLLAEISSPIASAVDPATGDAHGGIVAGEPNAWMALNTVGSGPYALRGPFDPNGSSLSLAVSPNYWATGIAAQEPWDNALQPAGNAIQLDAQATPSAEIADLQCGAVAGASFASLGPSQISQLSGVSGITVNPLNVTYGSTSGAWWVYMDQWVAPFDNLSVREAVVHAINYSQIIEEGFGGYAQRWVGPVPPGYPYYDPGNLTPYPTDLALAEQEMNDSPWPSGFPSSLNYEYLSYGDWGTVANILRSNLASIGIELDLVPMTLANLYTEQVPVNGACLTNTTELGGPFPIGQELYTSDYIAPDDWTQNDAISYGSANACMAGYNNASANGLVISAAGAHNASALTADYTNLTDLMYENYTVAWLVVPTQFQIYNHVLQGIVPNPMGSAIPSTMFFNTESA